MDGAGTPARRRFGAEQTLLGPYVPSLVADWLRDEPDARFRTLDGTLVFADVSGFTRLTELLAAQGKIGAEEMAGLVDGIFEELLSAAYEYGAGLIKYGGDAVLLLFEGEGHVTRGCSAAAGMQAVMRAKGRLETSRGPLRLRMSVGVHSGRLEFLLVGRRHRELIVTGGAATTVARMEQIASPGQIVISAGTVEALARAGQRRPELRVQEGFVLRTRPQATLMRAPLLDVDYGDLDLGVTLCDALREHILGGAIDSEHRRVTIGFVKFSGTDELLGRAGPEALTIAVERIVSATQDAAAANEVTVLGSDISPDGGKLLMIAGAPRQLGHDEDRMLATVRSVLGSGGPLTLRGGVHVGRAFTGNYGPAYRRTYSVIGDCVNLAARLMEHAPPGELLTTGEVIKRAGGSFVITAIAPFGAKGKREPVQAFSVGHSFERHGVTAIETAPMVGREAELELLLGAARDAAGGTGRVVDIVGPPGIGKSRLLAELRARGPGDYLQADGDIYAAATPFVPFERLLRERLALGDAPSPEAVAAALKARCCERSEHLLPWLPLVGLVAGVELPSTVAIDQTDPATRKDRLEEVTSEILAAVLDGPTTLVFNDVHLMDDASAGLIARLIADAGPRPWLVVTTRRPAEDAAPTPDGVARIDLEPLGPEAAERLLAQITAAAPLPPYKLAQLARRAGGNPLFLRELVARVADGGDLDDLPDSVEAAIGSRLDRLSPGHRRLIRSAAVLGVVVDVAVLGEVLRNDEEGASLADLDALDELLEPVDVTHRRFTHELIRTVAYEGLPYRRRALLHARTAEVIEDGAGADADQHADILSLHCLHGARFEAAWRYSRVAADRARDRYANADAAECLQRALSAAPKVPQLPAADLAEVDEALGDIYFELGEFRAAEGSLLRARRGVAGTPTRAAGLELKLAKLREYTGRHDAALRWIARGERTIDGHEEPAALQVRGRLLARRARLRYVQGRLAESLRVAKQAIELAERCSDLRALAEASEFADVAEIAMGVPGALARTERAVAIYEELGDLGAQARGHNTLGVIAYFNGRWPEAVEHYRAAEAAYVGAGQRWLAANAGGNIAEVLADQGHLEQAKGIAEASLLVLRGVGASGETAFCELQLGKVAARAGDVAEAHRRLAAARDSFSAAGEAGEVILADGLLAECHTLAGAHADALTLVDDALLRARSAAGASTPLLQRVRGIALLGLGRRAEAEAELRQSLATSRGREAWHDVAFALRVLTRADLAADAGEAAAWHAELADLTGRLGLVA